MSSSTALSTSALLPRPRLLWPHSAKLNVPYSLLALLSEPNEPNGSNSVADGVPVVVVAMRRLRLCAKCEFNDDSNYIIEHRMNFCCLFLFFF